MNPEKKQNGNRGIPLNRPRKINWRKTKSVERRDVKKLILIGSTVFLKPGEYFRESPGEWVVFDDFGKVKPYVKFRKGKPQIVEVIC
jgi:hypothetical protein